MTTIEILSELRSNYNCFDEQEEPVYRALSEAIKAVSAQPEPDTRLYSDGFDDGYKQAIKDAQPEIIRCKECRHNHNCDIQYHAQAGDMFFCAGAEGEPMSDLIDRQAAIELLREFANDNMTSTEKAIGADYCIDLIRTMPSAQPDIVYCGDCKYKDDGIDEDGMPFLKCLHGRSYGGTRINDYCSWGERRIDGHS